MMAETRRQLYQMAGQDLRNDIDKPDNPSIDYIDNQHNNDVHNQAMASQALDDFIKMINPNASPKQTRSRNNRSINP